MGQQAETSTARARILVAEDEPHIRRILTTMLESQNYEVVEFDDGLPAIEYMEGAERVDLVLTDLMMPGADGLEVLAAVREMPERVKTPILVLTAKGQDADRDSALALGARDFITKPFSPKKLLARIDEILQG